MSPTQLKTYVRDDTRDALVERLSAYETVVEVGVGHRVDVAAGLAAAGVSVTTTDIRPRAVPVDVKFLLDDITVPDIHIYEGCDALYALNFPPELHQPALELANRVGCDFMFTTLGGDPPAVPVTRETIPGDTLFIPENRVTE